MKQKFLVLLLVIGILSAQRQIIYAADFDFESEPNNSISTSIPYDIGKEQIYIFGVVSEYDQTDYYRFIATETGKMRIKFLFNKDTSSKNIDIDLYLYDSKENEINYIANSDGYDKFPSFQVNAGDYVYLRVDYDKGYLTSPYRVNLNIS